MQKTVSLNPLIFVVCLILLSTGFSSAQKPLFEKKLAASGQSKAVFGITRWGRYSIEVESPEGTALKLIDRKSGLRELDGVAGERNGRIDAFFDIGEYKIIARSHEKGTVSPQLKIYPFTELNSDKPRYLVPYREYEESLKDHEQRSYWIHLEKDGLIFFEVLGRNVADVQLWKNGNWRIDTKPAPISSFPSETTPLKGFRVVEQLKAGYYQLTMYGGQTREWAEKNNEHPLYFKWNITPFPSTGTGTYTISPAGYNLYLVPSTDHFVLTAPDKKETLELHVMPFSQKSSFSRIEIDSIHSKLKEPRCILSPHPTSGDFVARVSGRPGNKFTLKTIKNIPSSFSVDTTGSYWISTIHTGHGNDQIGASGCIIDTHGEDSIVRSCVDTVSSRKLIKRKFNLLDDVLLIFLVSTDGEYEINTSGAEMEIYVRRFFGSQSRVIKGSSPKMSVDLDKGYYMVGLHPIKKGIASLEIKSNTSAGKAREKSTSTFNSYMQFPSVHLTKNHSYSLVINSRSPEIAGMVFRSLPLNMNEPLPIYVNPDKPISVKISVNDKSDLFVKDESGNHYPFSIDGKRVTSPYGLKKGIYTLSISSDTSICLIAGAENVNHLPSAPPEPFPAGKSSPLPVFPEIEPGKEEFFSMERNDTRVYEFDVDEPGIYCFQTTGRLSTSLTLRDRFVVRTHHEVANGVGRNALIQAYLLPGRYQAVIKTHDRSTGRLSLLLDKNEMINGGTLSLKQEKRHNVPAGTGIRYSVPITNEATYQIITQGQNGYFKTRFDDGDGWPVIEPGSEANITRKLVPDNYQLISLPQKRDALRITRITQIEENRQYSGKGPHTIFLNKPVTSVWMEDSTGQTRMPALFNFKLPAPAQCRLSCTDGFDLSLFRNNDTVVQWKNSLDTTLPADTYTIEVIASKPQNHAEYRLSVNTPMLLSGLSYEFSSYSKKEYTVSVGHKTVVELFSQGMRDLAATLTKKDKDTVLAFNDDGTMDWNFKISRVCEPGYYTLKVHNAGSSQGRSEIFMSSLSDTSHEKWSLNKITKINLEGKIHYIPVVLKDSTDILSVTAYGGSRVGCVIERKEKNGKFTTVGNDEEDTLSLSVPVNTPGEYRIQLWSADHLNEEVNVSIDTAKCLQVSIKETAKGITAKGNKTGVFYKSWLRIDLGEDSLNHYGVRTDKSLSSVRTSPGSGHSFKQDYEQFISSLKRFLYVELQFKNGRNHSVKTETVNIDSAFSIPLTSSPRAFLQKPSGQTVSVFRTKMKNGIPMCGVVNSDTGDFYPGGIPVWGGVFDSIRSAVCVALPGDSYRFLTWNADLRTSRIAHPATIQKSELMLSTAMKLTEGNHEWIPENAGVRRYHYKESSPAEFRITLPQGGIILWHRPDGSRSVFSTVKKLHQVTFQEKKGTLYLINTGSSGYFSIECFKLDDNKLLPARASIRKDGFPFEKNFHISGVERIDLDCTMEELKKSFLLLHGSISSVDWWTGSGMLISHIQSAKQFPVQDIPFYKPDLKSGYITFEHDAGWSLVNLYSIGSPNTCWGLDIKKKPKKHITSPTVIKLKDEINWFSIPIKTSKHLQVSSSTEAVALLLKDNKPVKTFIGTGGLSVDVPLTGGNYTIGIRSVGNMSIENSSLSFSFKKIEKLTEKNPPRVVMASGESKIYRFTLPQKRTIGIGLDTDREVLQASLYTDDLVLIREGQQLFLTLEKGTYFLKLKIPPYQEPAECVVKLAGQDLPPDGPSQSEISKYKNSD